MGTPSAHYRNEALVKRSRIPRAIAILGSGPAGLLAALAAEQRGVTPFIYSDGTKSEMFGAMYLHEPIPGLTGDWMAPDFTISVVKSGTRDGYAKNVYGDPTAPCSWDDIVSGDTPAWDLRAAYDKLWEGFLPRIGQMHLTGDNLGSILTHFPLVLCTVPARALCRGGHEFAGQDIWIRHGPGRALLKDEINDDNIMYYNGYPPDGSVEDMIGFDWYRFSQINQYQAWEYSSDPGESNTHHEISLGRKPLSTDCTCWQGYESFHRIGRFGKWQKGVLTHHAYKEAGDLIDALL